jgi:hypothetical protein
VFSTLHQYFNFNFYYRNNFQSLCHLQELRTLPEYLSSPPVFSGVCVTRSLVLCVCFVDCFLSFCPFSFGHCVVCPSSIYGFCLPLWYLQFFFIFYQHVDSNFCVTNDHFGYSHNVNHNPAVLSLSWEHYHIVSNIRH